ncbi:MAG: hypothetical protein D6812_07995 [Deltaproteobacteria bacterium]|nr:MAG: hypothetical protein D6812_07995 [Deltaproteobacteria bacterium]
MSKSDPIPPTRKGEGSILLLLSLLALLLVGGCFQKRLDLLERDVETLQADNEALRDRVAKLEIALTAQAKVDLLSEIDEIRRYTKQLNGRLETTQHLSETTRQEIARLKEYLYNRVRNLNDRLTFLEERLRIRAPASEESAAETPQDPALLAARVEERYEDALATYRKGDLMAAREKLKLLVEETDPTLIDDEILFLLAECNYDAKIYDEAFLTYQDLIDRFPASPHVPDAILKQAFCLLQLGKEKEAETFLHDLIDRYPKSEAARIARKKLGTKR